MIKCKHEQLIDKHGKPCACEECGGKICKFCGLCFDIPPEYQLGKIPTPRERAARLRFRCAVCSIFVQKPAGVPPGKDCIVLCARGHEVTYHSPAAWIVQGFRDPVTGIEGNDANEGLSVLKPLKTIGEAMRRSAHPDVITVKSSDENT